MARELEGKVAIVTGGANGIGAATAELFVEERGSALAAKLGNSARFRRTDVGNRDEVQALVDQAIADFGDLDIMFNNAGFSGKFHNRFMNDPLEDFDRVLQVNLAGVMYGSQIAARHMIKQRKGSIINTSSIAAVAPGYAVLTYRAAKAGVLNFTKSLAIDLGEYMVRVNGIAPGHIPTGMNPFYDKTLGPERQAKLDALMRETMQFNQPLKRAGHPRDIAQMAMFLGSDRSTYVSGQVIAVDGGVTAGDPINLNAMCAEARSKFLEEEE